MTKKELAQMYFDYLHEEGYVPRLVGDSEVNFKKEGLSFWIQIDERDPTYFQLIFPNFWEIESKEEMAKAMQVVLEVMSTVKVAKVYPLNNNMFAVAELFCDPLGSFKTVFPRAVKAIELAVGTFTKGMQK